MAKLLVTFAQARDHLNLGGTVTVRSGDRKPSKRDRNAFNLWNGLNYTGKIVKLDEAGMDVEVEREFATVINHFDASYPGFFEINDTQADGKDELHRRALVATMSSEQRFDALMDEIEELRARVISLENLLDS
jgi:hypothetical protein